MFSSWCYRGSDRKRPRLESQSSEEEENDNIALIKMANEIKEETEEWFFYSVLNKIIFKLCNY